MMRVVFLSRLHVVHVDGKRWQLTRPLVWEGSWQIFVIREGFVTDFASIPKPVRWLLENSGRNSEAAVLHDAVWRESKRRVEPRVDPWNADGIFRRALRETGSPALTRGLMWFAVRAAAMAGGRFGRRGPSLVVKVLQLLGILALGILSALAPTVVAVVGLFVFWIASWIVALAWYFYERHKMKTDTNWPWPSDKRKLETEPPARELLLVVAKDPALDDGLGARLQAAVAANRDITGEQLDAVLATAPVEVMERLYSGGASDEH